MPLFHRHSLGGPSLGPGVKGLATLMLQEPGWAETRADFEDRGQNKKKLTKRKLRKALTTQAYLMLGWSHGDWLTAKAGAARMSSCLCPEFSLRMATSHAMDPGFRGLR